MDAQTITKIKNAVRTNYDESPALYQEFEDRYGFFRTLTRTLLARMKLPNEAVVLDVGCGTGASSVQISETIPESQVWGLDNSSAMLAAARATVGESDRVHFVEGDAGRLRKQFAFLFDGILYSACIFLIPDYQESLRQAGDLLRAGGKVGLTFLDGLYTHELKNALAEADREAREGVSLKKAVKLPSCKDSTLFPFHDRGPRTTAPGTPGILLGPGDVGRPIPALSLLGTSRKGRSSLRSLAPHSRYFQMDTHGGMAEVGIERARRTQCLLTSQAEHDMTASWHMRTPILNS